MAYEVTAARRRPQVFTELVGQEYVVQTLQSEMRSGNVAQTFLFSGPRGVGKTSAARILAKALNCEQGPTDSPCGTCGPCTEIARAQSLDVVEIDGASHTGVDDVRELRDQVVFPPSSARTKVYIIDEVHMLSTSAFNALLKTIEEPPPYVTFVFATTEPHKVPATVRSRCQHFAFSLIGHERIADCLRDAAVELDATVAADALHWIARQSAGSLRDAFMILDQVIAGARGQGEANVTLQGLRDSIGLLGFDDLNGVARAVAGRDVPGTLTAFDRALGRGVAVDYFLAELVEYFRSVLFLKHGLNRDAWLSAPADAFPPEVLEALSVEQAEKAVELLLAAQRNLKGALNERCEVELALSRLAELDRLITPAEVLERLRELQAAVGAPAPTAGGRRLPRRPGRPGRPPRRRHRLRRWRLPRQPMTRQSMKRPARTHRRIRLGRRSPSCASAGRRWPPRWSGRSRSTGVGRNCASRLARRTDTRRRRCGRTPRRSRPRSGSPGRAQSAYNWAPMKATRTIVTALRRRAWR